jgi:uncharacterized protein YecE (DUF72 family)
VGTIRTWERTRRHTPRRCEITIWIGTSGWQYDSWRGRFYPKDLPKARWLEFYADRFPVVEVNNSFYRLPSEASFGRWRNSTPERFLIAPKMSRYVTHIRRLRDAGDSMALFWSRAVILGPKLGPLLFQLPPTFVADPERLRTFVKLIPREARAAFEFRHPSWETDEVRAILDASGAALVLADRPGWRVAPRVTGGWSYIRFHQGKPLGAAYPRSKLRRWADRIVGLPADDVYVFFNNDPGGAAIRDAGTMFELLEKRGARLARPGLASSTG